MRRTLFCLLMLCMGAAPPRVAAQRSPQLAACRDRRQALRDALADIQRRQRNIGLSALVMLGGETVLAENLGYADLEHRVPVTNETRFGVASITKAFTGLSLLKLHEAGRIDLDAPIQRYVPAFPVKPGGVITARLLAAHLAGIRHWGPERNAALYARHFDDVNDIIALFKDDTLVAPPGTKASYSSYGYNLIGAAIQSASGVKYQDYVNREIISRLGLRNTGFDDVRRVLPNRARRYSYFDPWTFAVDSNAVLPSAGLGLQPQHRRRQHVLHRRRPRPIRAGHRAARIPLERVPRSSQPPAEGWSSSGYDELWLLRQRLCRTAPVAEHRWLECGPSIRIVRLPRRRSRHRRAGEHVGNRIQLGRDERRASLAIGSDLHGMAAAAAGQVSPMGRKQQAMA